MKTFSVDIDITVAKRFYVDAENENEAKNFVKKLMAEEPYYYAATADACVGYEITDVNED